MSHLTDEEAKIWRQLFDLWRESYDEWPYTSHQRFYNMVAKAFPEQKKYDANIVLGAFTHALSLHGHPLRVWELGGWDGALAKEMIEACGDSITKWYNIEICQHIIERGWDDGGKVYFAASPPSWVWEYPRIFKRYDIAILSHVIEHLSWSHLSKLLAALKEIPCLYIQTPLALGQKPHETEWMGTMSTHKLEVGWNQIKRYLSALGYTELWHKDGTRFFAQVVEKETP